MTESVIHKFKDIAAFVFDVDGVLTDGKVFVTEDGSLQRSMNIKDGYAVKRALKAGYEICIITGGKSQGVKIRLERLGIANVYLGVSDKISFYESWKEEVGIKDNQCLYMGDDIPDLSVLNRVYIPSCPKDAVSEVKEMAEYISPFNGGDGCARDVIEKVMRAQKKWTT